MKIALSNRGFEWGGGVDFIRLLCEGLLAVADRDGHDLSLLLPSNKKNPSIKAFLGFAKGRVREIVKGCPSNSESVNASYSNPLSWSLLDSRESSIKAFYYEDSDHGYYRLLEKLTPDVLLPVNGRLTPHFDLPWVGYIHDFQHRYLTQNFSLDELYTREIDFARRLRDSRSIIVNSTSVLNDVVRFYPWADLSRIIALPFTPLANPAWFQEISRRSLSHYRLPDRYFLISNQFWIHKDHGTAFRALALLPKETNCHLVCTGILSDYRKNDYIDSLRSLVDELDLSHRIHFLGYVSKRDQIEIMKMAVAIIQPTRFEGGPGGGSVYDAVSIGRPVVLSSIPVNREVSGGDFYFFSPGDPDDLARILSGLLEADPKVIDPMILLERQRLLAIKLGDALLAAIRLAF